MAKLFCIILLSLCSQITSAQQIRIRGSIDFTPGYNIKAGEDYETEIESGSRSVRMDVKKLKKQQYWSVTVNKSDINWDNSILIYVRRTTNGNGNGSTWGGTNYTQVRNIPQTLFQGRGLLNNIYLQYKLSGISVELPASTYYTDIVYTLYEQ